jgi:hypothetical protein
MVLCYQGSVDSLCGSVVRQRLLYECTKPVSGPTECKDDRALGQQGQAASE